MQTTDAENIRHLIGNPVFAIETNIMVLKSDLARQDAGAILDSMQRSVERIKEVLAGLDAEDGGPYFYLVAFTFERMSSFGAGSCIQAFDHSPPSYEELRRSSSNIARQEGFTVCSITGVFLLHKD